MVFKTPAEEVSEMATVDVTDKTFRDHALQRDQISPAYSAANSLQRQPGII